MKRFFLIIILCVFLSSCSECSEQILKESNNIPIINFLDKIYDSPTYGKDFYANTPVIPINNKEVLLLGSQTFIPYNENSIITVVAEILDTPDEVAVSGYVGPCSYRHKEICIYDVESQKLSTLVKIESGYVGSLKLHSDDILEYHCGSTLYTESLCLYDITNQKQHTVCIYEPSELEIINTISSNLYSSREFYFTRFNNETENFQAYRYNIDTCLSDILQDNVVPCIYNGQVCLKKHSKGKIRLLDIKTKDTIIDIGSDNKLYSVYESDLNQYNSCFILNNAINRLYCLDKGILTEYTVLDETSCVYFYTEDGIYVCSRSYNDSNISWHHISQNI